MGWHLRIVVCAFILGVMRWVIGDVHGMFRMLEALLEAVRERDEYARFYFVGDYVNRGPESKQVVDLLTQMPEARCVRGNHDEMFDLLLNGQCYEPHPDLFGKLEAFGVFLQFGLDMTLLSYGISQSQIDAVSQAQTVEALDALLEPIPQTHREFFRALPAYIEEPDLLVAHAKWEIDRPNDTAGLQLLDTEAPRRHAIVWGRFGEREIHRNKPWTRPAFFGHTVVASYAGMRTRDPHLPLVGPMITLLDSGAALSKLGRLSAVCVEDRSLLQVDRSLAVSGGTLARK